jgi:transposase-like protein
MLGVTYKTAWFMAHRIREAMREFNPGPLGGQNKVVEADETFVGGKAKNAKKGRPIPKKEAVFSLLERDGKVRSMHVPAVNHKNLRPAIVSQVDRKSYLMTDEAAHYWRVGREFSGHGTVNHSIEEYVRGTFWHTNTIEGYFSILKRGINGVYQHVSQQHLKRYLGEFDFRYNERKSSDFERTTKALKGIEGKRLTYRRIGQAANP